MTNDFKINNKKASIQILLKKKKKRKTETIFSQVMYGWESFGFIILFFFVVVGGGGGVDPDFLSGKRVLGRIRQIDEVRRTIPL